MAVKKTVVITGGSGRIGRFVARDLLSQGYTVRSIIKDKKNLLTLPAGTIPYMGDINDKKMLESAFKGADAVIHFAAIVSEYKSTTEKILETNVLGTRTVVEACEDAGVKHLIFPSTVDVYGRVRKGEKLTEASELKPTDKYGYSKMLAENVIKDESSKINYTIFRIATAYGPGFETSYFKIINMIKQQKLHIIGNGDNHQALIYVGDAARAFVLAIENKSCINKVYNLTDGENCTQKQLYQYVADALGVPAPTKKISSLVVALVAKTRNIDSDELRFITSDRFIDTSLIRKELGFRPKMGIKEGIAEMVRMFNETRPRVAPIDVQG